MPVESLDAVIVGGGPAGLATSQQLGMRGISNVVLERGGQAGWMWGHVYDGLRLHTGKHLSALPGMSFPAQASLFPTLSEFTSYVARYADRVCIAHSGLHGSDRTETGQRCVGRRNDAGRICGEIRVVATGIMTSPVVPGLRWDVVLWRTDISQHGISAAR